MEEPVCSSPLSHAPLESLTVTEPSSVRISGWGPDTAGFQQPPDSASLAHSLRAVYTYSTPTISYLAASMFAKGFRSGSVVKNPPANAGDAGDTGSVPGLGRSSGGGSGNPLQYSCLENPLDRGAWRVIVQGIVKSQIWPTNRAHTRIQAPWRPGSHLTCWPFYAHYSHCALNLAGSQ